MIAKRGIWFFICILILSSSAFSEHASPRSQTKPLRKRPIQIDTQEHAAAWWDVWGIKDKVVDAYQDTITWDVDVVFGKKAVDNLGHALISFLFSPAGSHFIAQNKRSFLESQLEDTGNFEDSFWKAFEEWLHEQPNKELLQNQLVTAVNLLPLQPKLNLKAYYPQTPVRKIVVRGVDHIYYLLADDIAKTIPGGGLAPRIVANALRRASQGGAVLPAVQTSYYQYRNQLTQRIVNLIGVLAKRLVEDGVKKSKLDIDVNVTVQGWEKTDGFKKNPTFPIRSYFYAKNAKNAIVPYQVTQFLDSLDNYDFTEDIKRFGQAR